MWFGNGEAWQLHSEDDHFSKGKDNLFENITHAQVQTEQSSLLVEFDPCFLEVWLP